METVSDLKSGQSVGFDKDRVTFIVKKHGRGVYSLNASNFRTRNRWGNLAEILSDLNHCLEYGTLPRPDGNRW